MAGDGDSNKMAEANEDAKKEIEKLKKLQNLFKNAKIFLNREVPRESLVFMIRAFGGQVSWDSNVAPGATFDEDDVKITHQICDRPRDNVKMQHIGRDYIQPQWIFDSINRRELLPVHKYFLGEMLPPHLSPFIKEERRIGDYVPPEEKELLGLKQQEQVPDKEKSEEEESESDNEEIDSADGADEIADDSIDSMKVVEGKPQQSNKAAEEKIMEDEQYRLRVMMVKNKHKKPYGSMMKARKKRVHESKQLERKRKMHDEQLAEKKSSTDTDSP